MTTPELHAEDLLDREARGALTPEEQARLASHLSACSVCRFEREVRADFREEFASLRASAPAPRIATAPRPVQARWRTVGLLAAGLLLAGVAGAEWARARQATFAPPVASARQAEPASPPAAKKARHRLTATTTPSAGPELAESALSPEAAAPSAAPSAALPTSRIDAAARSAQQAPASARTVASSAAVTPVATESAPSLFARASAAREQGNYEDAIEQYGELIRLYPSSREALTGRALLGRLLLDRGNPTAAISHFDAYLLSSETTLREEALVGRALGLGKLQSHTLEAAAWQELLRAYPGSVHAARARTRLETLEAQ